MTAHQWSTAQRLGVRMVPGEWCWSSCVAGNEPDGPSLQIFHSENQREKDERVSIQSDFFVLVSSLDFRKVLVRWKSQLAPSAAIVTLYDLIWDVSPHSLFRINPNIWNLTLFFALISWNSSWTLKTPTNALPSDTGGRRGEWTCRLLLQLLVRMSKSLNTSAAENPKGASVEPRRQDSERRASLLRHGRRLASKQISSCSFICALREGGHMCLQARGMYENWARGKTSAPLKGPPGPRKQNLWQSSSGTVTRCSFSFFWGESGGREERWEIVFQW